PLLSRHRVHLREMLGQQHDASPDDRVLGRRNAKERRTFLLHSEQCLGSVVAKLDTDVSRRACGLGGSHKVVSCCGPVGMLAAPPWEGEQGWKWGKQRGRAAGRYAKEGRGSSVAEPPGSRAHS